MEDVLIRFRLVGEEAQAFREFSRQELRKPNEQVRFIIRRELERRGLVRPVQQTRADGREVCHD